METEKLSTMRLIKLTFKFILFVSMVVMAGCYYDNAETLYPQLTSGCDTTQVTFSGTIKPILQNYCLVCHSTAQAAGSGGSVKLEAYTDVKKSVDNGKLWGASSQASGYSPMPKGGGKLDNCTLLKLKKWINDGAVNN
jgi:hypothetical protein